MPHRTIHRPRSRRTALGLAVALAAAALSIIATGGSAQAAGESVSVWLTTTDLAQKLTPQAAVTFAPDSGSTPITLTLNEGRTFQRMVGFGATFTDSSAWLVNTKLSAPTRAGIMQDLFTTSGSNGIGLTYLRQPASATDYIKTVGGYYTYDDLPTGQTDPSLTSFSISHDLSYLIPVLQQALAVNPAIRIQLNGWTAPAWMKSNGSLLNGGELLPQYYGTYATYLVKAIQAYEAQGVPIWSSTVGNEPTLATPYPSMTISAATSAQIVRDYLAPALTAAGLRTRILAGDDVAFDTVYPSSIIDADAAVGPELPATSMHGYWGDVANLTSMHDRYPDKDVYQTELSPGCSRSPIDLIVNSTRNWAQTAVTWNVALDNNNGPYHSTDPNTCKPLVRVDQATGTASYTDAFYQEGHASKFVAEGALRIDSTDNADVRNVAFKNTDGSKVLIAWNTANASRTFKVAWGTQAFSYTLPAGAIATFKWSGTTTGDAAGWGNSTFGTDGVYAYGGGLQTGTWSVLGPNDLNASVLGSGWQSTYRGYADLRDLTVSVDARAVAAGTTAAFPKYGIYACYRDKSNYVQAWIDPTSGNYATHAVSGGTDAGWANTALPGGFNAGVAHQISVRRVANTFTFYLDGVQRQQRTVSLSNCQVGLVTEDHRAEFRNLSVIDPLRWGSSQLGTNTGNIYAGGVRRGDWAVASPQSVTATTLGSGWSSLFRGYLSGDGTVSVSGQAVQAGTTSSFPKYGVYAAYRDENNYAQGWIDPTSGNYVTHAVVGGTDLGWVNNALPGGFNAHAQHTIAATRTGNTFAFTLDGVAQQTRIAAVGVGQVGVVSEDYRANFRSFTVSSDAGAQSYDLTKWYHVYNRRSLRQLSVLSGGTVNSTPTIIYDPLGATDQLWKIEDVGSGRVRLVNQRSGRALSVLSGGTANSTDTIIYDYIGATDQNWTITPTGSGGYVRLINQRSGRALSVLSGGTTNSTHTIIYDDIAATDQDWTIVPA